MRQSILAKRADNKRPSSRAGQTIGSFSPPEAGHPLGSLGRRQIFWGEQLQLTSLPETPNSDRGGLILHPPPHTLSMATSPLCRLTFIRCEGFMGPDSAAALQPLRFKEGRYTEDKEKRGWGTRSLSPCAISTMASGHSPVVGKELCIKHDEGSREGSDPGPGFRKQGRDFPPGPGAKTPCSQCNGAQVWSLLRELDSTCHL